MSEFEPVAAGRIEADGKVKVGYKLSEVVYNVVLGNPRYLIALKDFENIPENLITIVTPVNAAIPIEACTWNLAKQIEIRLYKNGKADASAFSFVTYYIPYEHK